MAKQVEYGSGEYDQVVALRDEVLRKPLGLTFTKEELDAESQEIILAEFGPDGALATLQFQVVSPTEWKMRQVAVAAGLQGKGHGSRLVEFSESWARSQGVKSIVLHARETAVPFYKRLGYEVVGSMFTEVNIPHFKMRKALLAAAD
jgi:predicted GNAT family N-acyltransferase